MPHIKVHPPKQLPEQSISQQEFKDWQNELEIYLGQDEAMARFMTDGIYNTWLSQEEDNHRIDELNESDPNRPAEDAVNRAELLSKGAES